MLSIYEATLLLKGLEKEDMDTERGVRRSMRRCVDELECYGVMPCGDDDDRAIVLKAAIYAYVLACRQST